jgi:predicted acylesterase/phospholipase RssA
MRMPWLVACLTTGSLLAGDTVRLEVRPPDYRFTFRPSARVPEQRRLVLALGGGAAKGIAHVGVLQRLEEEGLEADALAGTSAGAFIGALHGCGYSGPAIQELFQRMDLGAALLDRQRRAYGETLWEQESRTATVFTAEYSRRDGFVFTPGSSSGLELKRSLQWLLSRGLIFAGTDFSKLRAPLRAVSTNLQDGVADAPDSGNLVDVVRASMSVPGMFRPVVYNGKQHVDGLLVENLPVHQARDMARALAPVAGQEAVVLAVETGGRLDDVRATSLFTVLVRTLDVTIEERTRFSREAADLLLRPDTRRVNYLEFTRQVPEAVALGRASFDGHLEALEDLVYGPEARRPAPGPLRLEAPPDLLPEVRKLAAETLGEGATTRGAHLRLLRRLHAAGLAAGGELEWEDGSTRLALTAFEPIRRIGVDAPPEWRAVVEEQLAAVGLAAGVRFNPERFGRALDRILLEATLAFRPLVDFSGSGFEGGDLTVRCREPKVAQVTIAGEAVSPAERRYLGRLMEGLAGAPINARTIFERLAVAEARLNLEELVLGGTLTPEGPVLSLTPLPRSRVDFDVSLAFESTWGFHAGLGTFVRNLFGSGNSLEFQASTNRLQNRVDLDFRRAFPFAPRAGALLFARHFEQRFRPESLEEPAVLTPLSGFLADRTLRSRDVGFGFYRRFGARDQGLWRLEASRRWTSILPGFPGTSPPAADGLQASLEWDSFDRHTFPTTGTLVRLSGGEGRVRGQGPEEAYQHAYLRLRRAFPLTPWLGATVDLESGLGWKLPLGRWYSLGGPSFLLGTRSAGFLSPNFGLLRVGFPLRVAGLFGLQAQVEPRWDLGYLGTESPATLRRGARVRGFGLALRTEVGRFYVELAAGRAETAPEGQPFRGKGGIVNVLVGTRPFDLWQRR